MLNRHEGAAATIGELVLADLILARNDPALATMRDQGLFDDLADHHAREHGERVHGPVDADWIGPSTVRIKYHVRQHATAPPHHGGNATEPTNPERQVRGVAAFCRHR